MTRSIYTPDEEYRYTGAITADNAETCLDSFEELEKIEEYRPCMEEALTAYPDEDFLSDTIEDLATICKRVRGRNREDLTELVQRLADLEMSIFRSSEYGRAELLKILEPSKEAQQ